MGNNTTSVKVQPLRQNGMSIKTPEQLLLEDFDRKQNNSGDVGQSEPEQGQGFAYGGQEGYRALLDKIVNREGFSYDHEKDPVWSAYAKAYRREGDRAVEDTLAAASAALGTLSITCRSVSRVSNIESVRPES